MNEESLASPYNGDDALKVRCSSIDGIELI